MHLFFDDFTVLEDRVEIGAAGGEHVAMCGEMAVVDRQRDIAEASAVSLMTKTVENDVAVLIGEGHRVETRRIAPAARSRSGGGARRDRRRRLLHCAAILGFSSLFWTRNCKMKSRPTMS